jgi:hypothetical protein
MTRVDPRERRTIRPGRIMPLLSVVRAIAACGLAALGEAGCAGGDGPSGDQATVGAPVGGRDDGEDAGGDGADHATRNDGGGGALPDGGPIEEGGTRVDATLGSTFTADSGDLDAVLSFFDEHPLDLDGATGHCADLSSCCSRISNAFDQLSCQVIVQMAGQTACVQALADFEEGGACP